MLKSLAHTGVDAIQSSKKQWVSTFVQHPQLEKTLTSFVDAQTAYTKAAIDNGIDALTGIAGILADKTPYVELSKQVAGYFDSFKVKGK